MHHVEPATRGPLTGLRVLEIAGRGPGPFAGMLLADMGAEVLRVDRPDPPARPQASDHRLELYNRGRRSVIVDLKHEQGAEVVLRLVEQADAIYEGYRPGVAERLGIGPDACLTRNPRIVYGRATGWGQTGPLAPTAGHDINYIALAGALDPIGYAGGPPTIPLNLIGDYAGGGMMLAFGLVCALLEARGSGRGQVVDAAMIDGASLLMTLFHGRRLMGTWNDERGTNYVDSGTVRPRRVSTPTRPSPTGGSATRSCTPCTSGARSASANAPFLRPARPRRFLDDRPRRREGALSRTVLLRPVLHDADGASAPT